MRVVFFGGAAFARPCLAAVFQNGFEIAGVVVPKEKPKGRGLQPEPGPIQELALQLGLPVFQPEDPHHPDFALEMKKLQPDVFIVVAYGYILRPLLLGVPLKGSVGVHPSLLPRYRGAAPIQRVLMAGEATTGVTIYLLDERVDTGSMILQQTIEIGPEEVYGELSVRLAELGAAMLVTTLRLMVDGKVQTTFQDDRLASPAPKIRKEECVVDWQKPAREIFNLIRALSPQPAAYSFFRTKRVEIYRARSVAGGGEPGSVVAKPKSLVIATGDGSLEILDLKLEGKKAMAGADFVNGYRPQPGEKFGY